MTVPGVYPAMTEFARLTWGLTDADLEIAWEWQDYQEGVRFSFFRNYETLRELVVRLAAERLSLGQASTSAQRILAQYHAAFRDLQAVLLGYDAARLEQVPAEGEWSARQALDHMIRAERNFYFMVHFALQDARSGDGRLTEATEAMWDEFWQGDPYSGLRDAGSPQDMLAYYEKLHTRILDEFVDISEAELDAPAVFWENQPYPIRFRLHRFDSHLRQHTIQIEKTLLAIGGPLNEARRLLRLIFAALAEAEGVVLGTRVGEDACRLLASEMTERTTQVAQALASLKPDVS